MGYITGIEGYILTVKDIDAHLYDLVRIGDEGIGEVISIEGRTYFIQVFTPVQGLSVGEKVEGLGEPLTIQLGPHLAGHFFDGLGANLELQPFYKPTLKAKITKRIEFIPKVKKGRKINKGAVIGEAVLKMGKEEKHIPVLAPPNVFGKVIDIKGGKYKIDEPVAEIGVFKVAMSHRWPIRKARPYVKHAWGNNILLTGQRIIDAFLPVLKGGTLIIPGGFGCGKTVFQHNFAKFADAQKKVFVGCGERGNEMADFIEQMKNGGELLDATILTNTSNMPLVAREGSVYAGVTIAEYYRDMGYSVLLMIDSLSRWAEAIREVAGIMKTLPAEAGYPPYLQARMEEFFSRAGCVKTLNGKEGCLTISSSVSPPSGDFSEPVTQYAAAIVDNAIFLNTELAYAKIYPAVDMEISFSKHKNQLANYWDTIDKGTAKALQQLEYIIHKGMEVEKIERIVGADALSTEHKITLRVFRLLRNAVLIQNAFHPIDRYTEPKKLAAMINIINLYYSYLINLFSKEHTLSFKEDIEEDMENLGTMETDKCLSKVKELRGRLGYV